MPYWAVKLSYCSLTYTLLIMIDMDPSKLSVSFVAGMKKVSPIFTCVLVPFSSIVPVPLMQESEWKLSSVTMSRYKEQFLT